MQTIPRLAPYRVGMMTGERLANARVLVAQVRLLLWVVALLHGRRRRPALLVHGVIYEH